ncbi:MULTISPECIES: CNP1-like family protein [Thiorhodovibrio]|uniref:CNP1-like family protein n=1 Tax=Thiorhodovibrio TaxID=61593 RepID=UPI001911DA85|nr:MULTISPECIES: CNP1-like family protein [Thiorhodovibrio]MBK5971086.1 hypothetical protein [Thiorhodovibrio winogradskyi]WPL10547.1 CNP1-like family protein [Thiorhodovibrio litoralis]
MYSSIDLHAWITASRCTSEHHRSRPRFALLRLARLALGLGLGLGLSLCATVSAQENMFVNDAEPDTPDSVRDAESWKEGRFNLPAWPLEQDLIPVRLDNPDTPFDYFIDARSLNTGADGVVRYTLVAESASGARNLSFEGLRCTPHGEYRIYAYGQQNRFESAGLAAQWLGIDRRGTDPVREELWRHYLCVPRKFAARPKKAQVRLLRNGRVSGTENTGFLME